VKPTAIPQPIPLIKDNEQRLAKMRRQLEDMFRSLHLVHDEIGVASEAARSEGQPEIANVLSLGVCNRLYNQLKSLTNVIERLGGRTDLSESEEPPSDHQSSDKGQGEVSPAAVG
jgi:hypothetical protein